jgi:hypothetical protein
MKLIKDVTVQVKKFNVQGLEEEKKMIPTQRERSPKKPIDPKLPIFEEEKTDRALGM